MNVALKNYWINIPSGVTWRVIGVLIFALIVNSYLIVNWIIDSSLLKQIQAQTNGTISPVLISFFFSTLIYIVIFNKLRENKKAYSFNQHQLMTIIIMIFFVVLFSSAILLSIKIETSEKIMSLGYFLELVSGAICEEITFRLFMLSGLIQLLRPKIGAYSIWTSIIVSSIVFSVLHMFDQYANGTLSIYFFIYSTILSWILCWIYISFSNLYLVIFLHLSINLFTLYLPVGAMGKLLGIFIWILFSTILAVRGYEIRDLKKWS